jgi:hypothetical protein
MERITSQKPLSSARAGKTVIAPRRPTVSNCLAGIHLPIAGVIVLAGVSIATE